MAFFPSSNTLRLSLRPYNRALSGPGLSGLGVVLTAALLPIITYFMYLIASLPLELWRAILSLPGKLDSLKR